MVLGPLFRRESRAALHRRQPFVGRMVLAVALIGVAGLVAWAVDSVVVVGMAATRLTVERDRKSWDIFLATPVDGREILRSKVRAVLLPLRRPVQLLGATWLAGIAVGAVHPLGALIAGVDMALSLWAVLAVTLNLILRPIPTAEATSRITTWSLFLMLGNGPLALAALGAWAGGSEMAEVLPAWFHWTLTVGAFLVPIATPAIARHFTRQLLLRSDEWVGRPIRPLPAATFFAAVADPA